jgi:hypothetical protein
MPAQPVNSNCLASSPVRSTSSPVRSTSKVDPSVCCV